MKSLISRSSVLPFLFAFTLVATSNANPTIERVEFFVGEDPGRGNAITLDVSPGVTTLDANFEFPADSLPSDRNVQVTIRAVDSEGNWSPPEIINIVRPFLIENGDLSLADVEYTLGNSETQTESLGESQSEPTRIFNLIASSLPDSQSTVA